jgi:hypothetical protein
VRTHVAILMTMLFALCAVTAVAADISGKWTAQVPGRDGTPQEQVFMFKVSGGSLTGTVSNPRGEQEISEGKVSGDDVSFVVVRKMQDMEMKTTYKGKISGNEIKFTSVRPGRDGAAGTPVEFTAKK